MLVVGNGGTGTVACLAAGHISSRPSYISGTACRASDSHGARIDRDRVGTSNSLTHPFTIRFQSIIMVRSRRCVVPYGWPDRALVSAGGRIISGTRPAEVSHDHSLPPCPVARLSVAPAGGRFGKFRPTVGAPRKSPSISSHRHLTSGTRLVQTWVGTCSFASHWFGYRI